MPSACRGGHIDIGNLVREKVAEHGKLVAYSGQSSMDTQRATLQRPESAFALEPHIHLTRAALGLRRPLVSFSPCLVVVKFLGNIFGNDGIVRVSDERTF
jgi:hypothetical protein